MTFPTGVDFRKYSEKELTTMLEEAGEVSKHARKLGRVMGVVAAHRIKDVREFLAYQQLATWRRENGFDRVAAAEKSWSGDHRSLPPTPDQYTASLWSEVNALRDAISMPRQKVSRLINATEQGNLSAEEYATFKRLVEKRVRETAQGTAVTRDGTEQHCSPCSPNPDRPSEVHFNLENNEGKMGQELEKLESSSADTGLETPGQQGPPNEGAWEKRRTTVNGFLTASVDSSQGGRISSPKERVGTRAGTAMTPANSSNTIFRKASRKPGGKTPNEENKQFDPGGRGEKAPPWNAAVTLPFFSGGELRSSLVCFLFVLFFVCLHFVCALFLLLSQIIDLSR